jgi:uncharacterized protein YecT (DUF1311 family)
MRLGLFATIPALAAAILMMSPAGADVGGDARAASFDCNQAAAPAEYAVCGDPRLSELDGEIGSAYAQRLAVDPSIRQVQRGWLKARNIGCGKDRSCLGRMMAFELGWLRGGQPPASLPTSVGACSGTRVSRVGSRLDGDPGSGSAIEEANGATQISYDDIPAIDASRVGDPALVCLVSLPRNCPPGDDRGKTYAVANLRTLGAWSEADSEHMCGGA